MSLFSPLLGIDTICNLKSILKKTNLLEQSLFLTISHCFNYCSSMKYFSISYQEILVNPLSILKLLFSPYLLCSLRASGGTSGDNDIISERFLCVPLSWLAAVCCVGMRASSLSGLKHIYLNKCLYHMLRYPEEEAGTLGPTQPRTLCSIFHLNNETLTAC